MLATVFLMMRCPTKDIVLTAPSRREGLPDQQIIMRKGDQIVIDQIGMSESHSFALDSSTY